MVVLSAAICTKSGKILLSRQFIDISRVRIEGLLASFPKLMESEKQHTFIETESVRYIYHPLESIYVLLITNKASNIIEDLDTLQLFVKIIPEYCKSLDEEELVAKSFDLIFAFDEVVAFGHKEKVTLGQIRTFTEMDSHEERMHEIVEQNKLKEAQKEAKRRQMKIDQAKSELRAKGITTMPGMGSSSGGSMSSTSPAVISTPAVDYKPQVPSSTSSSLKKGMVLSKGKAPADLVKLLNEEEAPQKASKAEAAAPSAPPKEPIEVSLEEKVVAVFQHDGGMKSFEVKGDLNLFISNPNFARVKIILDNALAKNFQTKVHPNTDKKLFQTENVLALRDETKSFPVGTALGLLKYRAPFTDDSQAPLNINCWPTPGAKGSTVVNMEYELGESLKVLNDLAIVIPIPGGQPPKVNSVDGNYRYDPKAQCLIWEIPVVDESSSTGCLEFVLQTSVDSSSFFPINASFNSPLVYANLSVKEIVGEGRVGFSFRSSLSVELYEIQ